MKKTALIEGFISKTTFGNEYLLLFIRSNIEVFERKIYNLNDRKFHMRSFDYSYLKNKTFDAETIRLVGKIREYKGRLDVSMFKESDSLLTLEKIAKRQSTDYSNRIEGVRTTDARFKKLLDAKTTPKNRDEEEILGYHDVLSVIHENYDAIPINPNIILQLHRDLLGKTGKAFAGHFKNTQNAISSFDEDGKETVIFLPLSPFDTPSAIEEICLSYKKETNMDEIDPLILIPCFILDFLCIHPFNDGNGRMSRLLTLLLLYQNGFTIGKYISIEKQIADSKDLSYDALSESDINWHEGGNDPSSFIRYMLRIILSCYIELDRRLSLGKGSGGKPNAYEVVKAYVYGKIGKITVSSLLEECPSLRKTSAIGALNQLIEEGIIERRGVGKNTHYVRVL